MHRGATRSPDGVGPACGRWAAGARFGRVRGKGGGSCGRRSGRCRAQRTGDYAASTWARQGAWGLSDGIGGSNVEAATPHASGVKIFADSRQDPRQFCVTLYDPPGEAMNAVPDDLPASVTATRSERLRARMRQTMLNMVKGMVPSDSAVAMARTRERIDDAHFEEAVCRNCGTVRSEPHCGACGQKAVARLDMKDVANEFWQAWRLFEASTVHAVLEMIRAPGLVAREYVLGGRFRADPAQSHRAGVANRSASGSVAGSHARTGSRRQSRGLCRVGIASKWRRPLFPGAAKLAKGVGAVRNRPGK